MPLSLTRLPLIAGQSGCTGFAFATQLSDDTDSVPDLFLNLIEKVFKEELKSGEIDRQTVIAEAQKLFDGVVEGFGKTFDQLDYDTPHYKMLSNLQKNVYQFAAAKNYQELRELTNALYDGDRLRSFSEFKAAASKIVTDYNMRYTRVEYNTAISSGLNAANWATYQEHKKAMPNLKYVTAGDERVRDEHRKLDGVVRPIDDEFWKTHYPPLAWNCRCTTYQLAKSQPVTAKKDIPAVEIPKMFRTNLAEHGVVFPPGSSYYIGCPKEVINSELKIQRPIIEEWARKNLKGNKYPSPIGDITITMTGISKTLSEGHPDSFLRNEAIYKLPEILKTAKHHDSSPDTKGKVKQLHYLEFDLSGKKNYIVIKESFNGDKNFYCIQKSNKKKNG